MATRMNPHRRRRLVPAMLIALGIWLPAYGQHAWAAEDSSVTQLLETASAAYKGFPEYTCEVTAREYFGSPSRIDLTDPDQMSTFVQHKKGPMLDVTMVQYMREVANGPLEPLIDTRMLWDGSKYWRTLQIRKPGEPLWAQVDESRYFGDRLRSNPDLGAFLDGRFTHNYDGDWIGLLAGVLSARVGDTRELVDGHSCVVFAAEATHGNYRLWLDPAYDYRIRKARVNVEGHQIAWGKRLADYDQNLPGRTIQRLELEVKDVVIEAFDGRFLGTSGTCVQRFVYSDGSDAATTKMVERKNLRINPDFAALDAFDLGFESGDPIEYVFANGAILDYMWTDAGLAPRVDTPTVAAIDRAIDTLSDHARAAGTLASLQNAQVTVDSRSAALFDMRGPLNPAFVAAALLIVAGLMAVYPAVLRRKRS